MSVKCEQKYLEFMLLKEFYVKKSVNISEKDLVKLEGIIDTLWSIDLDFLKLILYVSEFLYKWFERTKYNDIMYFALGESFWWFVSILLFFILKILW